MHLHQGGGHGCGVGTRIQPFLVFLQSAFKYFMVLFPLPFNPLPFPFGATMFVHHYHVLPSQPCCYDIADNLFNLWWVFFICVGLFHLGFTWQSRGMTIMDGGMNGDLIEMGER